MEKVNPAIFNVKAAGRFLGAGLIKEDEVPPVIELPDQAAFRKPDCAGQW